MPYLTPHLHRTLSCFLALAVVLTGCGDTIADVDFPEPDPRLTVISFFGPDSTWRVRVAATGGQDALDNRSDAVLPRIDDATVEVLRNGAVVDTLPRIPPRFALGREEGLYGSNAIPAQNGNYTLRVSAPDYPSVMARNAIPAPVRVEAATFADSVSVSGDGRPVGRFTVRFQDPPGEDNFYRVALYYVNECSGQVEPAFWPFDTNADIQRDVFADPEALLNGTVNEEFPIQSSFVFSDEFFDGQSYALTVTAPTLVDNIPQVDYRLVVSAITEDYYQYQYSLRLKDATEENPYAEPVRIRTNVDNGYGIFAGYRDLVALPAPIRGDFDGSCF